MIGQRPEGANLSTDHPAVELIQRMLMRRGDTEGVAQGSALAITDALIETNMLQDGVIRLGSDPADDQSGSSNENLVEELARAADDELQQQGAQTTDTDLDYQAIDTKALVRAILDARAAYEFGME